MPKDEDVMFQIPKLKWFLGKGNLDIIEPEFNKGFKGMTETTQVCIHVIS